MILFLLLPSQFSFSQSFEGIVKDIDTGTPIAYANVFLVELSTGTITDEDGRFVIENFPKSRIQIQISFIGYKTVAVSVDMSETSSREFFMEESHIELEEVVVSIPSDKLQGENVVDVSRRRMSELQFNQPLSLAEAISQIPGVNQTTTGSGIGKPVIRGLSGNRIVTYSQGIRMENQQWGDEHGLGIGQVGIENVEIIKGPASLLYGSDALGGVLYFIDERYARLNSIKAFGKATYHSNTAGFVQELGFKIHKSHFKFNLFGSSTEHADYNIPELSRIFNSRFKEKNIKGAIGYNYKNWVTNFRYSFLQNDFGLVDEPFYHKETSKEPVLPAQKIDHHNFSLENTIFSGDSRFNLLLGYTINDRKEFEEQFDEAALSMQLKTLSYNLKWYAPSLNEHLNFIMGIQGMHQKNENNGEEILIPDATMVDVGGFLIVNYNIGKVQLQGGIRADRRDIDTEEVVRPGNPIVALNSNYSSANISVGAVYSINTTTIRANIATAFRAPNTSELLSNGVHEGTRRYEIGTSGLKSEQALQMDVTYDFQNEHFRFTVNPFFQKIDNYIFLMPEHRFIDNARVFRYLQSEAKLYGGEVGIHYHPHGIHWLHVESNLSTVIAEDSEGQALPLIPAHKLATTLKVEFSKQGKFSLRSAFVSGVFNFDQSRVSILETPTSGYSLYNFGLNFEIMTQNSPIEINAGINNLFDQQYISHLSRFKEDGIFNQGRNISISAKFTFEKSFSNRP